MNTTERNWLIRTSQNQILGPVAKSKVVEFANKGALGLSDEICSGNGYWFHLRERDLVEKYLLGDVPQSFNPIAEAQSVYSRRENPDKTTSINASPANRNQLINSGTGNSAIIPSEEDLDFPDLTLVGGLPEGFNNLKTSESVGNSEKKIEFQIESFSNVQEDVKIPAVEDLEYPDLTAIVSNSYLNKNESAHQSIGSSLDLKKNFKNDSSHNGANTLMQDSLSEEIVNYPKSDDLEFPTIVAVNTNSSKTSNPNIKVPGPTNENIVFEINIESNSNEKNDSKVEQEVHSKRPNKSDVTDLKFHGNNHANPKIERSESHSISKEERKLLTNRKIKNSKKDGLTLDKDHRAANSKPINNMPREIAPELKKRNDSYLFIILVVLIIFILAVFFYYYRFILNKPLPV